MTEHEKCVSIVKLVQVIREVESLRITCLSLGDGIQHALDNVESEAQDKLTAIALAQND